MVFFRIKKIKGKEYVYLVENEWKKKSSRQKVKAYIGRAYRFNLVNGIDFLKYSKIQNVQDYIEKNGKNKIIHDLVEWELFKHGISKKDLSIDLNSIKIQKNSKDIALLINEGFMCNHTLKALLDFKPHDESDGYLFAKYFVEAGIKVPEDIFVGLFDKLYKTKLK